MPVCGAILNGEVALVLLPAFAVVIGHRYPLFFRFSGGTGVSPLVGLLVFAVVADVYAGGIFWHTPIIAVVCGASMYVSTRRFPIPGVMVTAFLAIVGALAFSFTSLRIALFSVVLFGFASEIVKSEKLLVLPSGEAVPNWRFLVRPLALLLIPIDVIWNRNVTLIVLTSVTLVCIILDLIRPYSKRHSSIQYREKAKNRFTSMSLFFVATSISFLVFAASVPYVALTCITVGGLFCRIVGLRYGKTTLIREKTLEGSLAFFAGSLSVAYLVALLAGISIALIVTAVIMASTIRLFFNRIDDAITITIVTGAVVTAGQYLF